METKSIGQAMAVRSGWKVYVNGVIARELSRLTRYFDEVIQFAPRPEDSGSLLAQLETPARSVCERLDEFPKVAESERRVAVLLNGNLNHHYDAQKILMDLKERLSRSSRVLVVAYNPYLSWLYTLANLLGVRQGEAPKTFLTTVDVKTLARLSGYELVRIRPTAYIPWECFGVGTALNRLLAAVPGIRWMSFACVLVFRPVIADRAPPSLTVVIPARNERGNIENALKRMPNLGCDLEVVFIEGHSSDGTWEEIQRVQKEYSGRFKIQSAQQTGKGKSDAVRLGFSMAKGDVLTILDADLTMPPELLGRFYRAYADGLGDFINGSRLVYPMEGDAMRFLNRLGNIFFAKALSWVLDIRIGDSLCGTKMVTRRDYQRMIAWRGDFGDYDPFGDFELIFPAATLGLGIVTVPIRYLARTYGSTNILRFRHGLMLLRMTLIGFWKIKRGD